MLQDPGRSDEHEKHDRCDLPAYIDVTVLVVSAIRPYQ